MKLQYKCKLCSFSTNSVRKFGFHIRKIHNLTNREYFDTYMKKIGEGYCYHCLNKTPFLSLSKRYQPFCCLSCGIKAEITQNKMKENCKQRTGYEHIMQDPVYRKQWEKSFNKKHRCYKSWTKI